MLQLKKTFPLLGLLVVICFFSVISEISPVFAYTDTASCSGGMCFVFDSDSGTSGYRFGMGARINITGVTTAPNNPVINVTRSDPLVPPAPTITFPMLYDPNTHTVYLGAISGLPTYMMIDSTRQSCVDINTCDPFVFNTPAPGAHNPGFTVKYIPDRAHLSTAAITSSPQRITPAQDDSPASNPYQPYKNVRAACVGSGTWDAASGFCTNWRTSSGLSIQFTANSVTATYKWDCVLTSAEQIASGFIKDYPCTANPGSNDVYLEIDYMKNHKPDNSVILDLINSFSQHGITLHVQLDERIAYKQFVSGPLNGADSSDFTVLKNAWFGTSSERTPSSSTFSTYCTGPSPQNYAQCVANLLTAKRQVFHYVLFGDQQTSNPSSSGVSEGVDTGTTAYAANDIFVSLGQWNYKRGSASQMESTLMHELGHNLGLNHGGPYALENTNQETDVNCKPNYLSVMSYTRQFPILVPDRDLTYSSEGRSTGNNLAPGHHADDINETNLSGYFVETPVSTLTKSTAYFYNQPDPALSAWLTTMANNPDWNNNGNSGDHIASGTVLQANSVNTGVSSFTVPTPGGTNISIQVNCGSGSAAILDAYDDWHSLGYNIWGSSSAYDGAGNGPMPTNILIVPTGVR